jgi:predicted nucleic acid-binding protein
VRLYLDTAPVIYTVEQVEGFAAAVDERLGRPEVALIASDMTRMECRVKPLREANTELLEDFDTFFADAVAEIVALSRSIIDRATAIRAQYGFRTPDAIHLAAAVESSCEVFLTNDHRLDRFGGIQVEVV